MESPREALMLLAEAKERAYAQSCHLWLEEQVQTIDETVQKLRPFPVQKDYVHDLITVLTDPDEHLIAIPKSRRMIVTWTVCAWMCWEARYKPHFLGFLQSENEEKAAFAISKRMAFIEDNLTDRWNRRKRREWRTKEGSIGKFQYEHNDSMLWGIPQGSAVIRGYTFSAMVMDESEFQREGPNALVSALPIVENGAKLVILSSSNGPSGILADICAEVGIRHIRDWVPRL